MDKLSREQTMALAALVPFLETADTATHAQAVNLCMRVAPELPALAASHLAALDEVERLTAALRVMRATVPKTMKAVMFHGRDGLLLADEIHRADDIARAALEDRT